MAASPRAFVLRHTRLRPVPGLEEVRLHLADEVLPLWHAVQVETDDPDAALPYWAFAWARRAGDRALPARAPGGRGRSAGVRPGIRLRAVRDRGPARRRAEATGADIDAFAAAAIGLNARANGRRVAVVRRDVLDEEPPDADVILAGDCWYEAGLAERVLPWLHRARDRGIDVLVGDPGRRYLPTGELVELATYDVRTTTELEDLERKHGRVYALRPRPTGAGEEPAPGGRALRASAGSDDPRVSARAGRTAGR